MIKLLKGDCLKLMQDIPDESIDLVLTDPPYGTTACKWDTVIPFEPMWAEIKRITKDNGAICLFGSEPFSSALRMSNIKMYKYDWVWKKNKPSGHLNAKKRPLLEVEQIMVFYKNQSLYNPQGTKKGVFKNGRNKHSEYKTTYGKQRKPENASVGGYPRTILEFSKPLDTSRLHPTQKPVALLEYLIKTYTIENETVLDFTMGSGSTGVACSNLKRDFIGIELDDDYFNIAEKRIMEATNGTN
jgi:site-specific DNA-methyltransferase (adenine-specific)